MSAADLTMPRPPAPPLPPWRGALRRIRRSRLAMVGLGIITCLALCAVLAPWLSVQHPDADGIWTAFMRDSKQPPSPRHWMGTDKLGRDVASRIVYGARTSLLIGVASVSLAIVVGTALGAVAGFFGRWIDGLIMRLMDVMLAFPSLLLALGIVSLTGPRLINAMLAVGIVSIPTYARIVRASVLAETGKDYVHASRALGAGPWRLLVRHVMPNALAPLIVAASLGIGTAILEAAGLGFLGLGAQPPLAGGGSCWRTTGRA
ncbi:MAG: ABC transporter permease [Anaerolineae bacterium]